jgi:glycosyltransferase involved in cell wall biosynthesis
MTPTKIISAQPDEPYFHWQLDIQLQNLAKIGKDREYIILLGIFHGNEESNWSKTKKQQGYLVFTFPITYNNYVPTLRFELLYQFYKSDKAKKAKITEQNVHYIDSDVIFREWLDESKFNEDATVYLSDCNSYLNYDYITSKGLVNDKEDLLRQLTAIVGVDLNVVKEKNKESGGCHYYFKPNTINEDFWYECFVVVSTFYDIGKRYEKFRKETEPNYHELQIWCADMWVVLWSLWKNNVKTKLSDELKFTWATDNDYQWHVNKIYHNAGVSNNDVNMFNKLDYKIQSPFMQTHYVRKDRANWWYAKEINEFITKTPLISIITFTSNRPETLQEAYKCFVDMQYDNKEFVIVSNNSDIDYEVSNEDLIRSGIQYADVRVINLMIAEGLGDLVNKSIVASRGDYVHFLDDDDLRLPNTLLSLKRSFDLEVRKDKANNVSFENRTLAVLPNETIYMEKGEPVSVTKCSTNGLFFGLFKREYFKDISLYLPSWALNQDYRVINYKPLNTRKVSYALPFICYQWNNNVFHMSGASFDVNNEEQSRRRFKECQDNTVKRSGKIILKPLFRTNYYDKINVFLQKMAGIDTSVTPLGQFINGVGTVINNVKKSGINEAKQVIEAFTSKTTDYGLKRLETCKVCPVYTNGYCGTEAKAGISCGCYMIKKVHIKEAVCPQGKW